MIQQTCSLNGTWGFHPDPTGDLTLATFIPSRSIPVPLPWQAAFPDLQRYSGWAWYQRTFEIDLGWLKDEVLLTFGAVDYWCAVYINGEKAGEHEGGYTPFTLAVGHLIREGENQVAVRVYDPIQSTIVNQRQPNFPVEPSGTQPSGALSIPHGKQEWYVNVGGIWQDVTLRAVPITYIDNVKVTTALDGTATVWVALAGADEGDLQVEAVVGWKGETVATALGPASDGAAELSLCIPHPKLWTHNSPNLYDLTVRMGGDEKTVRFGVRTIEIRDGRVLLNGEPIYLVAALDQDFYRETIYTPPSEAFMRDQFRKAKELGLNCLRCHIKVPDPIYLELADEMGLLVWCEIPSWRTFYYKGDYHPAQTDLDQPIRDRVETTLGEMIDRDFNHPSLIIWTMVNEDWGTMLPFSASDRTWVRSLYDLCKQLDPTRLVVDNSACLTAWGPNIHVKSDLEDWHTYANIPDAAADFVHTIEQLNMRPLWTYSSHGDVERRGDEPVIVSEFGNWGLASVKPFLKENGSEPDWFDLGPWWSTWDGEPGWMRGVTDRFKRFGLDAIFGDYDSFATATQWHQHQAMKFEIEAMRRLPVLMGYVITEFTDCYWEGNGLLDFDRRPKAYHDIMRRFNNEDVLAPEVKDHSLWEGDTLEIRVHGSHFSGSDWTGARLEITVDDETSPCNVPAVPRGEVRVLDERKLLMTSDRGAQVKTADMRLSDQSGNELTHNTLSVLVLPKSAARAVYDAPLAVVGSSGWNGESAAESPFAGTLRESGYNVVGSLDSAKLAVTTAPTTEILDWTRGGGDLLFVCSGVSPFFWAQGRGGAYSGNWMSCWSWIRPDAHPRLAHPELNPLKLPFIHIMPRHTITGLPVGDRQFHDDFLAGQISGWVNHPAVHTVQFRFGTGRVIMTTFALAAAFGTDPVGTAMLHDLIDWLASGACLPSLHGNR